MITFAQLVPFVKQTLSDIDTSFYILRKRNRVASVPLAWLVSAIVWFSASGMLCWKRYTQTLLPLMLSRYRLSYGRWTFWRAELGALVEALCERLCIKRSFRGLALIDSTVPVCGIQRERDHKCFKGVASKGCAALGWLFGFKLHLIVSADGELLRYWLSTGSAHDTQPLFDSNFMRGLAGCLAGDSGYRVRKERRGAVASDPGLVVIARPVGVTDEDMPWALRKLFKDRWRVETSFGELKDNLGLRLAKSCKTLRTLKTVIAGSLIAYTLNRRLSKA